MPNQQFTVNTRRPFGAIRGGRQTLRDFINWLESVSSGEVQGDNVVFSRNDAVVLGDEAFAGQAVGLLRLSGGAGAVGATIDGTLVTAAFAVSDTATMTAVCAAIRAAAVNRKVTAVNRTCLVGLASVLAGSTLQVFGITFTAINGTPTKFGEFNMAGADAADATSLALAINRHPSLAGRCRAVANGADVCVGLLEDRAPTSEEVISMASAATFTIFTAAPTVGINALILAMTPGDLGNCCTVVASGTGMTYTTSNAGKLGSGQGGGSTLTLVVP